MKCRGSSLHHWPQMPVQSLAQPGVAQLVERWALGYEVGGLNLPALPEMALGGHCSGSPHHTKVQNREQVFRLYAREN